jgi:hypothetical protein
MKNQALYFDICPCDFAAVILASILTVLISTSAFSGAAALPGQIIVDPGHSAWLRYHQGGPFFMCGPGDPEDFLYRGTRNPDGTRNGDQMTLITKLKGTGANAIYLMAVRSHGGDGDATHNPFVNNNPAQGLNMAVLNQWETWFTEMDNHGIVIFFFFYDDSARIWNTGDSVSSAEKQFIQTLVNRFEHHQHLIWVVAEEYQEVYSAKRVSNIAAEIRAADAHAHPIAVHKLSGLTFSEFAGDPNIDQFAIQYNVSSAATLHNGMVTAWNNAAGRYNLNMSEAAGYGNGPTARQKSWAIAMGGAYVMALGWDIASTPISDLEDCGRLVHFMTRMELSGMVPHDALRYGGTQYVLAKPGERYIAYAANLSGDIGLKGVPAGRYDFSWYDIPSGLTVTQLGVSIAAGDQTWPKPPGIGQELAMAIERTSPDTMPPAAPSGLRAQ